MQIIWFLTTPLPLPITWAVITVSFEKDTLPPSVRVKEKSGWYCVERCSHKREYSELKEYNVLLWKTFAFSTPVEKVSITCR